jgi:cell division protein FtsW
LSNHNIGHGFYYIIRHAIHLVLAIIAGTIAYVVPTEKVRAFSPIILLGVIILLILVLIPGIGRSVNGAYRWIHLIGINIQVSEAAKLGLILYLASYIDRKQDFLEKSVKGLIVPLSVILLLCSLVLLEPDFGGMFILITIGFAMLFFAGIPLRFMVALAVLAFVCMLYLAYFTPYRLARLTAFYDPWANPFGDSYQLTQSLMAIGRGGIAGIGLGYGLQKQLYLPEAHTDFIYAVLSEEFGFIGMCIISSCFLILALRCAYWVWHAAQQRLTYEAMTIYGMMVWWSVSVVFSIGVNLGLVPTKGIALPFLSYGGSNLLVNACAAGVLLRITKELSKKCK